jgi:hypothetical protein
VWKVKIRKDQFCPHLLVRDQSMGIEGCGEVK